MTTVDQRRVRDWRLVAGLVGAGAALLLVAAWIGHAQGADAGTLPDWITAVATLAALLAATYAAVQASRTFRLEQRRDWDRFQAERRAQASLVAVWTGVITHRSPLITQTLTATSSVRHQAPGPIVPESMPVTIRNASDLPVYHLTVDIYVGNPHQETPVLGGQYRVEDLVLGTLSDIEVITPEIMDSLGKAIAPRPNSTKEPSPITIGWTFRDVAGVYWRRTPDGRLDEHTPT